MMEPKNRAFNFSPGPATLPLPVLTQIQNELFNWKGLGASSMEVGHRTRFFSEVREGLIEKLTRLLNLPKNYQILLMHGGAQMQFSAIPLNLGVNHQRAAYVHTGRWSYLALEEAKKFLTVDVIAESFQEFPNPANWKINQVDYLHYCDNETISGLQNPYTVKIDVPLVVDMSSNLLSRPLNINDYGLVYACAQKNLGIAGVTVVIVRDDLIKTPQKHTPALLSYQNQLKTESMYNTPANFSWYVMDLVLNWIESEGGLTKIAERNQLKASLIYQVVDNSQGFYRNAIHPQHRSLMNISFHTQTPALDNLFVIEAEKNNLKFLKGHALVGGMRASMYNAMPLKGAEALKEFMLDFCARHG